MATERYIHGKHDDANHDGRYSNIKRELEADVQADIADQLIVSLKMIRVMPKDSEIYAYHKAMCDFWLEPLDNSGPVE